jgi:peptide chain release factor 1
MLDERLTARLREVVARASEIETALADPDVARDPARLRDLGRELSDLRPIVDTFNSHQEAAGDAQAAREMLEGLSGADAVSLREELEASERAMKELETALREQLAPKDPRDAKDVIIEIRAAAGGDEAALFAGDLFQMYQRYAEVKRFKTAILTAQPGPHGGFKEVTFEVRGKAAFNRFKFESGVHRVQRIPATESQGRIHTSTATVAVMPEADQVEVEIDPSDLEIDVYRSSGPGGQSVNTTDSAVRITHKPTGEVVACQEERSQLQNRERAMRILRARLYERAVREQQQAQASERKGQVGSGDRSEKIRTYNFKENRVTDHRVGLTLYRLTEVLTGDLDELVEAMAMAERAEALAHG